MNETKTESTEKDINSSTTDEKGLFDYLWKFFGELKVAIVLLIILAAVSMIGTVIEQNAPKEKYIRGYGLAIYSLVTSTFLEKFVAIDYEADPQSYVNFFGERAYNTLNRLGLTHLYSSAWFLVLIGVLGFTILVCSTNRLRMLLSSREEQIRVIDPEKIRRLANSVCVQIAGDMESAVQKLRRALSSGGYRYRPGAAVDNRLPFAAESGAFRRWGSFFTHASLLLIYIGAIVGHYAGFEDFAVIPEGEAYYEKHGDFWVRTNDFSVEFDEKLRPLDYKSNLSVIDGDKEVKRKTIEVNHPLVYKGIYFYQSSYGVTDVDIRVVQSNGDTMTVSMSPERPAQVVPGFPPLYFASDDVFPDRKNPRIFMRYIDAENSIRSLGWVTDESGLAIGNYHLFLTGMHEYTGLQIKKDPGVPVVWIGCTLLVLGMCITFFVPNRRVFGVIVKEGEMAVSVAVAGTARGGDEGFKANFDRIAAALSSEKH
ncbi:MAG: cytochrome c biogenesis protein ResB [bacterium]